MIPCTNTLLSQLWTRGVGAATVRVIPMAIVSFGTYEMLHVWLTRLEQRRASGEGCPDGLRQWLPGLGTLPPTAEVPA